MKKKNLMLNTIITAVIFGIIFIAVASWIEKQVEEDNKEEKLIETDATLNLAVEEVMEKRKIEVGVIDENKDELAIVLAKTVWGEARDLSRIEQAAVVWCALNIAESRYENPTYEDIIESTVRKGTFYGYKEDNPYRTEHEGIARDVLDRYEMEKEGALTVGRVLPKDYLYFVGDGLHNHFRNDFNNTDKEWDWSLPNPYIE